MHHEQRQAIANAGGFAPPSQGYPAAPPAYPQGDQQALSALYPSLDSYMGLQLTPQFIQENMPVVAAQVRMKLVLFI